jgi:hypothetical protein
MCPQNPEPRDLRRKQRELGLKAAQELTGAPIPGEEGRGVQTLDRIGRVAGYGMGEKTAVHVKKGYYQKEEEQSVKGFSNWKAREGKGAEGENARQTQLRCR